jgi:hypothetical protein
MNLIINDLSLRFREHQFVVLDSLEKLLLSKEILDLIILNRDIYELAVMEKFASPVSGLGSKKDLEDRVMFFLGKVYTLLKPEGELYMIAPRLPLETDSRVNITFRSEQEKKNFLFFAHIFKTKERYRPRGMSLQVNVFDLQKYLNPPYVEKEVIDWILQGRDIESMSSQDMQELPYLDFSLHDGLTYDQEKGWESLLSVFFDKIFLKALLPKFVGDEWQKKFAAGSYKPQYMLTYLGQKKPLQTTFAELKRDVMESRLSGNALSLCQITDSHVISTLKIVKRIRAEAIPGYQTFVERLRDLENKKENMRSQRCLNHLNQPDREKVPPQPVGQKRSNTDPEKLETLSSCFSCGELKSSHAGATLPWDGSSQENDESLKPLSDLAQPRAQSVNLLRTAGL